MKTISKEEIKEEAKLFRINENDDGAFCGFIAGAEWAIQELQQAPQSEVMTLDQCRSAVNTKYKVVDLEYTEEEREAKAVKLYGSQFDVKNLQTELEQVKAERDGMREALENISKQSYAGNMVLFKGNYMYLPEYALQALQSTKQ